MGEQPIQQGQVMSDLRKEVEDKFKMVWGWTDLAMNVAKETLTSYFEIMNKSVYEVIGIAKYLQDKIELIQMRNNK